MCYTLKTNLHSLQVCMNQNIYCKEAVQSVEKVSSCPTSKEEWDKAASRKNCREKALKQNCTIPEKFVYHCVINGYGNATLEVCAPERIILGNILHHSDCKIEKNSVIYFIISLSLPLSLPLSIRDETTIH